MSPEYRRLVVGSSLRISLSWPVSVLFSSSVSAFQTLIRPSFPGSTICHNVNMRRESKFLGHSFGANCNQKLQCRHSIPKILSVRNGLPLQVTVTVQVTSYKYKLQVQVLQITSSSNFKLQVQVTSSYQ